MRTRNGQADDRSNLWRYIGELSRIVVISTSVLGTVAAVVLLVLVVLRFLGLV